MNEQLPPYSGDEPRCSKCSNVGAYTEWQEASRLGKTILAPEHLRRRCARCDYEWNEALNPPKGDGKA